MGTSCCDMPLAADDSLEGEGGVDEGTSRRDMPLALADDNLLEGEWGLGTAVVSLSRGSKLALDDNDLFAYFLSQLATMSCPNIKCNCLEIVTTLSARSAIAKYLTWFERRQKHEQDSIAFEWCR